MTQLSWGVQAPAAPPPVLRDYQRIAFQSVVDYRLEGHNRALVAMATGGGKTEIFARLAKAQKRMLVLAHREELLDQAANRIARANPGVSVGIEQANRHAGPADKVVIASVQSLVQPRRLGAVAPEEYSVVMIDEAHHTIARTYLDILARFGLVPDVTDLSDAQLTRRQVSQEVQARFRSFTVPGDAPYLVGVTATPSRSDGRGLEWVFDDIVYSWSIRDGVEGGWLVPIHGVRVDTATDLSGVRTRAGDFAEGELSRAVNLEKRNQLAVQSYQEHAAGRQALVFCVDRDHAHAMLDAFLAAKLSAGLVLGDTPAQDRRELMGAFRAGDLKVLVNVMVACLDEETEVLTLQGWKGLDALHKEDLIANWEDGEITFDHPKAIVCRMRAPEERMVSLASRYHALRVTERHRMVYRGSSRLNFRLAHARDLVGRRTMLPLSGQARPMRWELPEHKVLTAQEKARRIRSNSYVLRRQGMSAGEACVEAERRLQERYDLHYRKPDELGPDECRLIGFWLGDGSLNFPQGGGREYTFSQAFPSPGIAAWLDGLFSRLGLDVRKRSYPRRRTGKGGIGTTIWSLPRGTGFGAQRRRGAYPLEPYLDKWETSWWWALGEEQFDALLEGLWLADGDHRNGRRMAGRGITIYSAKRAWLSMLQAVAVCRGYRARLLPPDESGVYRLSLNKATQLQFVPWGGTTLQTEEQWKLEPVWCVESTTGKIVTRYRGAVTVVGNTEGFDVPSASVVLMARPTKSSLVYTQMLGRATRPLAGVVDRPELESAEERRAAIAASAKPDMLVIDLVDLEANVQTAHTLFGLPPSLDLGAVEATEAQRAIEELQLPMEALKGARTLKEIETLARDFDPLLAAQVEPELAATTELAWAKTPFGYVLDVPEHGDIGVIGDLLGQAEVRYKPRLGRQEDFGKHPTVADAMSFAEQWVADVVADVYPMLRRNASWRRTKEAATPKQVRLMKQLGARFPEGVTKGQASMIIDRARAWQ